MGEMLVFQERKTTSKGLDKSAWPQFQRIKKLVFQDDLYKLTLLNDVIPLPLATSHSSLLYPACGVDILYLLLFIRKAFPQMQELRLFLNDLDPVFGMTQSILDEVGISFIQKKNYLDFYWDGLLVHLSFHQGNIFSLIPHLPDFNLYFERAFRIMKDQDLSYEQKVFQKLASGGMIISDSGYHQFPLRKIAVPAQLSSYQEMIIGVK